MSTLKDELRASADLVHAPRIAQQKAEREERLARLLPPAIERIDALMREWAAEGGYSTIITLSNAEDSVVGAIMEHYHNQWVETGYSSDSFGKYLTLAW